MSFVNRQLYKQKPQAWGPVSAVKASIFKNAERAGIDPGSIALCMPMWGPGNQLDYARGSLFSSFVSAPYFANNRWYFRGDLFGKDSISSTINKMPAIGTGQYTFIFNLNFELVMQNSGFFAFGAYDPAFAVSTNRKVYLYDSGAKTESAATIPFDIDVQIGFCRNSTLTNCTDYYYNGVKDISVTHADSLSSTTMTIGSDRTTAGLSFEGSISSILIFSTALQPSQIAYLSDNPYFLLHRVPHVFYSVPGGEVLPTFNPLFLNAAQPTRVIQ